eukprot:6409386-Pyramimonas_sp.AAC.1
MEARLDFAAQWPCVLAAPARSGPAEVAAIARMGGGASVATSDIHKFAGSFEAQGREHAPPPPECPGHPTSQSLPSAVGPHRAGR